MGASCEPICCATLLGGCCPNCHILTALSAPTLNTVDPSAEKHVSKTGEEFSWLIWAFGEAKICCPLLWTSQQRTPESQLDDTKKLAVGLQFNDEMPSVPAWGTLQSVGAIDAGRFEEEVGAGGDPNVDIVIEITT
jgi:hypothetical protein